MLLAPAMQLCKILLLFLQILSRSQGQSAVVIGFASLFYQKPDLVAIARHSNLHLTYKATVISAGLLVDYH